MTTTNTIETTETEALSPMDYIPYSRDYRFEVTFDFEDATFSVIERHESENMTSFHIHYGHGEAYELPANADASRFGAWIAEDVQPILDRIKAGYDSHYNGNNNIARFTEDAIDAKQELDELFCKNDGQAPVLDDGQGQWNSEDWHDNVFLETIEQYKITAQSSDAELDDATEQIDAAALEENVRLSGTRQWLEWQRDKLIIADDEQYEQAQNK